MEPLNPRAAALGLAGLRVGERDVDFGDPAGEAATAQTGTVVMPLLQLATVHATGTDTDAFLQGQLSNDITLLSPTRAQLSSYNTPKGRALALFTLLRLDDGSVLLETEASVVAETAKRLRLFVMRSKMKLDEAGDHWLSLGLAGPDAAELLAAAALPAPAREWETGHGAGLVVLRRPGGIPRFSVHGPTAALSQYWARWSALARPAGTATWRLLDILAGVPSIHAATREEFVPQMLNLDAIGGISFTKGCYPGQEIVARLHYLGVPKRRMVRAFIDSAAVVPEPGAPLHLAGGDGQAVGAVVDAALCPDRGIALLLVLQTALQGSADLIVGAVDHPHALTGIEPLI